MMKKIFVSMLAFAMLFMAIGTVSGELVIIEPNPPIPTPTPMPGPGPLPGTEQVWTGKFYYEVGEPVDIKAYLPNGWNCIASPSIKNVEDGKYYFFQPFVLWAPQSPGTYSSSWNQEVFYPFDAQQWEERYGIDLTEQDLGTQVPPGLYEVTWYGATTYFMIGSTGSDFIDDLPEDAFAPGAQSSLKGKFTAVENMMEAGNYDAALKKLVNDIIPTIEKKVTDEAVMEILLTYAYHLCGICEENL